MIIFFGRPDRGFGAYSCKARFVHGRREYPVRPVKALRAVKGRTLVRFEALLRMTEYGSALPGTHPPSKGDPWKGRVAPSKSGPVV